MYVARKCGKSNEPIVCTFPFYSLYHPFSFPKPNRQHSLTSPHYPPPDAIFFIIFFSLASIHTTIQYIIMYIIIPCHRNNYVYNTNEV